jgi:hypothetical protein
VTWVIELSPAPLIVIAVLPEPAGALFGVTLVTVNPGAIVMERGTGSENVFAESRTPTLNE